MLLIFIFFGFSLVAAPLLPQGYYYPSMEGTAEKKAACTKEAQKAYDNETSPEDRHFARNKGVKLYVSCMEK
jgi:hypothetical protein